MVIIVEKTCLETPAGTLIQKETQKISAVSHQQCLVITISLSYVLSLVKLRKTLYTEKINKIKLFCVYESKKSKRKHVFVL